MVRVIGGGTQKGAEVLVVIDDAGKVSIVKKDES